MSKYSVLASRLNKELIKIETVVQTAASQAAKAKQTGDADYLQAAALSLQNFYRVWNKLLKKLPSRLMSFCQRARVPIESF